MYRHCVNILLYRWGLNEFFVFYFVYGEAHQSNRDSMDGEQQSQVGNAEKDDSEYDDIEAN